MLSKVLSKSSCASCKFCCSFRRMSLWETPLFPHEIAEKLSRENEYGVVGEFRMSQTVQGVRFGRLILENNYRTDDPEEEVPCTFLDPQKGCILNGDDKPFDCSIWPLRIMDKAGELVIALTPTCPTIGATPGRNLVDLVKSGLGEKFTSMPKYTPTLSRNTVRAFRLSGRNLGHVIFF